MTTFIDPASWLRRELFDIARKEVGLPDALADRLADSLLLGMRRQMGGREVYIPAPDKQQRDQAIKAEFNGRNLRDVMDKFGVSRVTVYRACK